MMSKELIDKFDTIRFSDPYIDTSKCGTDGDNPVTSEQNDNTLLVEDNSHINRCTDCDSHTNRCNCTDSSKRSHTPEEISYWVNWGHFKD